MGAGRYPVNCLAPGLFPRDGPSQALAWRRRRRSDGARTHPARAAPAKPTNSGWAATYMCSPYATYLTGHTLVLDGANWLRRYGLGMPEFEPVREVFDKRQKAAEG